MTRTLKTEIELLETLQALHQQHTIITLRWLEPGPDNMKRHILNMPRIEIVRDAKDAVIIAGKFEQLQHLEAPHSIMLVTDDVIPEGNRLIELLIKGYRKIGDRLFYPILRRLPKEKQMRILVITNLYPPQELGGYGRSIYDYVSNLKLMGHDVQVISSDAPYLDGDLSVDRKVDRRLELLGSYNGGVTELTDLKQRRKLINANALIIHQVIEQFRPQAVLLGNLDLLGNEIIHQILKKDIGCWHHHGFSQPTFSKDDLPKAEKAYYPLANSYYSSREIHKFLSDREAPPVIYPGAMTNMYDDIQMKPLGGDLNIAFAGLLIGAKGVHILLEALNKIKKIGIPFNCEIAGGKVGKEYPNALEKFAKEAGISTKINFLGKLDRKQLRELFIRNQIFVFPSTWQEPFGISQVEAMAAGCLVVSSGTGGAGETVHDDINGRRFRPSDSAHLAEVLCEIYRNPGYHEPLRKRGRRLARTHFDTARQTIKLSEMMIEKSTGYRNF